MNNSFWFIGKTTLITDETDLITKEYCDYKIYYHDSKRFAQDHVFHEYDDRVILLDGVIFNKRELSQKESWENAVYRLTEDSTFPEMLRGSFSGAIVYKSGSVRVFTDHCGERPVFYYKGNDMFAAATDLNLFAALKRNNKLALSANKDAFNYLLSYGFMIDNGTCYKEIKRLMAAETAVFDGDKISTEYYHLYDNTKTVNMSDDDAIKRIDELFRNALKLEFDKDLEYGYKHLVDISGGLDCRTVNYVAKDMGYKNILNISFSQIGSNEYKASVKMAHHLGNELLFYSLDSPVFIFDIDKLLKMNNGLCVYFTTTGASKILSHIDFSQYGIEHGGLQGDMREGSFNGYSTHEPANVADGMQFSDLFKIKEDIPEVSSGYANQEMFDIYTRGFLGGLSSIMIRNYFAEYYAPFMDPDFYDFYLSMPLEQRGGRQIFKQWLAKCYPQAYTVEDDRDYCRMDAPKPIKVFCNYKTRIIGKINRIGMKLDLFYRQNSMNPLDYWYKTIPEIKDYLETYYNDNKYLLSDYHEIKIKADRMICSSSVKEKMIAVSVVGVIKNYL